MDPTIAAAALGAFGLIGAAYITTSRTKRIEATLGQKNGQGNVIEMLEHLKEWTDRHQGRHDLLERQLDNIVGRDN